MSNKGLVLKENITNIANTIRNNLGISNTYKPRELAVAVQNAIDKYKNNNPTSTVTDGILSNALDVPVKNYKVFGNSKQGENPSPSNPQNIYSVGDLVTEGEYTGKYKVPVKISGKNLCDNSKIMNGIRPTYAEQGFKTSDYIAVEYGKSYIASVFDENKNRINGLCFNMWDKNLNYLGEITSQTITISENIAYISLRNYQAQSTLVTTSTFYYLLEEGTTATAYEPYHEPITTNIYLDEPLRGIATVKDYIDFITQKRHNLIGKTVLNGSENWEKRTASHNYRFSCNALSNLAKGASSNDTKANLISNYFKIITADNSYSENDGDGISLDVSSTIFIFFDQYKQSSLQDLKTWLASHNIELGYELATPTEQNIELPQLTLFEGTNIIEIGTETQATTEVVYITKV